MDKQRAVALGGGQGGFATNRWAQLALGVACMVAASNIQYSWTLFVPEIQETTGWTRAAIQTAFTIFVLVQTWSTPVVGHFIDTRGPRNVVMFGGVAIFIAWLINSYAGSLTGFYVGGAIGGLGVACVYSTCINNALKWFPDRRGLAVGLTAGGYGSGTILTILPIAHMLETSGYQHTFFVFAFIQGIVIFAVATFLRAPKESDTAGYAANVAQSRRDYTLQEALRTPVFWVMLGMFTATVTGGLMAVAQLGVMAEDLGVKEAPVNFYFFTMAALPMALMIDRLMNGISRPLFGWISDHIGREYTMFLAFAIEGTGIFALAHLGGNPVLFVLLSGVVFLAWGEVYSLFSATAGDAFGTKHIGKIYGALYTAKGIAALLVPFGNILMEATGSWSSVLYTMSVLDISAAICAVLVLRPLLRRHHQLSETAGLDPEIAGARAHPAE
ncbi:oxalate/formate MFS antiporter [Amaricoccus solimangrovi]|uniref:Oxalate/formate MFS antiporter n=1 Tax=Amaricoccus solimangrovi TaxID=2589815 RepID=A0A501WGV8_9RHOB|nr:oxalate/formate MFS antiporter [Amaricoccus solimangrovi]TPE48819.1 oxalate/formate MFS antiporter [Amaricoccus solimangrovi]